VWGNVVFVEELRDDLGDGAEHEEPGALVTSAWPEGVASKEARESGHEHTTAHDVDGEARVSRQPALLRVPEDAGLDEVDDAGDKKSIQCKARPLGESKVLTKSEPRDRKLCVGGGNDKGGGYVGKTGGREAASDVFERDKIGNGSRQMYWHFFLSPVHSLSLM